MDRDCKKERGMEKPKETERYSQMEKTLEEAFWWTEIYTEMQDRDRKRQMESKT